MNKEVKALWIAALRSGEYKQGKGSLHLVNPSGETYCCLGVLCDLAWKAGIVERTFLEGDEAGMVGAYKYGVGEDAYTGVLPSDVMGWSGVEFEDGQYGDGCSDNFGRLTNLNDVLDYNFNQIADVIEEKF